MDDFRPHESSSIQRVSCEDVLERYVSAWPLVKELGLEMERPFRAGRAQIQVWIQVCPERNISVGSCTKGEEDVVSQSNGLCQASLKLLSGVNRHVSNPPLVDGFCKRVRRTREPVDDMESSTCELDPGSAQGTAQLFLPAMRREDPWDPTLHSTRGGWSCKACARCGGASLIDM